MHGGSNRIYGLHVIHNSLFAECGVLNNSTRTCCQKKRSSACGQRTKTI